MHSLFTVSVTFGKRLIWALLYTDSCTVSISWRSRHPPDFLCTCLSDLLEHLHNNVVAWRYVPSVRAMLLLEICGCKGDVYGSWKKQGGTFCIWIHARSHACGRYLSRVWPAISSSRWTLEIRAKVSLPTIDMYHVPDAILDMNLDWCLFLLSLEVVF